ncbi:MAG: L,D-transpeptidase family protein, partial [Hyphomicrobiales bacterium]
DERLIQVFVYYESRSFKPIWVRDNGPKTKGKRLLNVLRNAEVHGLVASDYRVKEIEEMITSTDPRTLAELDLLLSRAMIDYGRDLKAGRIEPSKFNRELNIHPQSLGAVTLLDGAEAADDIEPYLDTLAPQSPRYARLKTKLAEYRQIDMKGGWIEIPKGEVLKPDMEDERVSVLRDRLIQMGDLETGAHTGLVYDGTLVEGVKRFQYRHGIDQDGVIGPATLAQFNVPIDTRIEQMELNLERRRWMPAHFGDYYVFVNLADQFLKVVRHPKTIHTANVVVGKPYHRTPVFSENMKYIVVNPYWNVPRSIAVNEYLPKLKRNPGALASQNIKVLASGGVISPYSVDWASYTRRTFPFRLRQDPGKRNALGKVKFMFPNKFNVYIHDTPSKSLFSRSSRAFSHGCVRVQDPQALAEVLLAEQSWSKAKVGGMFATSRKRVVKLKQEIPVHITYLTSWVNKDMGVHFRKDVYNRDELLAEALGRSRLQLH